MPPQNCSYFDSVPVPTRILVVEQAYLLPDTNKLEHWSFSFLPLYKKLRERDRAHRHGRHWHQMYCSARRQARAKNEPGFTFWTPWTFMLTCIAKICTYQHVLTVRCSLSFSKRRKWIAKLLVSRNLSFSFEGLFIRFYFSALQFLKWSRDLDNTWSR